jgi:tetratricopeptide (TPR) repeat protein
MGTGFLARFTPSLMSPEMLEAIFVQREPLAVRVVDLVRESVLGGSKHHTLLVGPRGIGKTHFVALVYHRLRKMEDLSDHLRVAWLREEEWGVASFLDLLLRMMRALREESVTSFVAEPEATYGVSPGAAEKRAAERLREAVGGKTLLLIVENLGDLFDGLGQEGQKRLRAFIQENPFVTILATAQSLFGGVSLRTSPFYGFFRIHHLERLSLEQARELLIRIATVRGNAELGAYLKTPEGRARVSAVHHLAGGNHRVYVILSEFLSREGFSELVGPFMTTLDDLTPYYQARIAWLSRQQRKLVEYLCERRGAAPVKEIARACFITHQTASGQLRILRELGYVRAESLGRESYYELREPLMRLCIEVKKSRGEPIRLLIEFLRAWHSREELKRWLASLEDRPAIERQYLERALAATKSAGLDVNLITRLKEIGTLMERGDFQEALRSVEPIVGLRREPLTLAWQAMALTGAGRVGEAQALVDEASRPGDEQETPEASELLLEVQGWILARRRRYEDALAFYDSAVATFPGSPRLWAARGRLLTMLDRHSEAVVALDRAIEIEPRASSAWALRAQALREQERPLDALRSFEEAVRIDPKNTHAWLGWIDLLLDAARWADASQVAERALRHCGRVQAAVLRLALARLGGSPNEKEIGDVQRAALSYDNEAAVDGEAAQSDLARSLIRLSGMLGHLRRSADGARAAERAITIARRLAASRPEFLMPDLAKGLNNLGVCLSDLGRREDALQATREAADIYRTLAASCPDAFLPDLAMSLNNLGVVLCNLSHREEALAVTREAADIYRTLAASRPDAFLPYLAGSLDNLGTILSEVNRSEDALKATSEAVEAYRRLVASQRDLFSTQIARTLNNLCDRLLVLGRREAAQAAFLEAVAILETRRDLNWSEVAPLWRRAISDPVSAAKAEERVLLLCEANGLFKDLGQTLIERLPQLRTGGQYVHDFDSVLRMVRSRAGHAEELRIPLRIAEAAVKYVLRPDRRTLVELPVEERRVITSMLGLDSESGLGDDSA